ncbi:hypothetical protein JOM56_011446 [Amanita muscaria]
MATNSVVRASLVSSDRYSGLIVDPLEDTTVPPSPAPSAFNNLATYDRTDTWSALTPLSYASKCLKTVFKKNVSDFDRAQALYQVFIETASEIETTSHFNAVMTRIADNLVSLGCKNKPCTQHCDRSHCEPCTLEHATPCMLSHTEPCTLTHADSCPLPHFFVTPEPCTFAHIDPCTLSHAEPCTLSHADPCILTHAEPCVRNHAEPCALNHFPIEPERVAIPIPCPLAHNDPCTREHISNSPTITPMDVVPTDTSPPLAASVDASLPTCPLKKQLKRKRFKHKKTIAKLTRAHENDILCRSQNNSDCDYEMDSDGFCHDPLNKQEMANIKRELYEEDDNNFVDTMRNLMNLADESDFLAEKKTSKNGPGFIVYPSPSVSIPHPAPFASYTSTVPPAASISSMPHEAYPLPPASVSVLPLRTLVPPRSRPLTPPLVPKVSFPRAQTEPVPTRHVTTTLPQRAQTAPPDVSKNTLTARRCTNNDSSPSSFVKFMDIPVTMTREHIHDCLKNNRKWSTIDISNVEIFAIKNKDLTVVNVLKVKFKDDAQSTTVKKVLTTSISFGETISRRCRPWYLSTRSN